MPEADQIAGTSEIQFNEDPQLLKLLKGLGNQEWWLPVLVGGGVPGVLLRKVVPFGKISALEPMFHIVVPGVFHQHIIKMAHNDAAGHLGLQKSNGQNFTAFLLAQHETTHNYVY